jgi:spore maturation protein CgeB
MINVAFFHQHFLVQTEVISALKRLPGVRVVVIDIKDDPAKEQSLEACRVLGQQECSLLFTINDWGMDRDGEIAAACKKNAGIHINWCVDDPFFMEVFHGRPIAPASNRLDFVSNRAYVAPMREKGLNAHFLPLAADPAIFFPPAGIPNYARDLCFVGNSYRAQVNDFCSPCEDLMERLVPFMGDVLKRYEKNMLIDLEGEVAAQLDLQDLPPTLSKQKAIFIVKHFISYLFRKRAICSLAREYPGFVVFGDPLWKYDLSDERVFTTVGYYTNLRDTYVGTKINIDINRVVITEGLTQRVFDCSASGGFIITNNKPIINEFFETGEVGKEVVMFDNGGHLKELVNHYLTHDEERKAIARRAQERVLKEHTYDHRMRTVFKILSEQMDGSLRP